MVILGFVCKDVANCKCSSHKIDIIEPDTEKRKSLVLFSELWILLPGSHGENYEYEKNYKSGHVVISSYAGGEELLWRLHIYDWFVVILNNEFLQANKSQITLQT